jgi:hypothetical protein
MHCMHIRKEEAERGEPSEPHGGACTRTIRSTHNKGGSGEGQALRPRGGVHTIHTTHKEGGGGAGRALRAAQRCAHAYDT